MYRYNPKATYTKDDRVLNIQNSLLTNFQIVINTRGEGFDAQFENFLTHYLVEEVDRGYDKRAQKSADIWGGLKSVTMPLELLLPKSKKTGEKFINKLQDPRYYRWHNDPLSLWQTQLNFAIYCSTTACGISLDHLHYSKSPLVNSLFRFHVIYQIKRVLRRLGAALPTDNGFKAFQNTWQKAAFYNLCNEFDVPSDFSFYNNKYFYPSDGKDNSYPLDATSYTRWMLQESDGLTRVGLIKLSESVRIYTRLILGAQVQIKASIVGNRGAEAATVRQYFMHEFEILTKRPDNLQDDLSKFQMLLKYAQTPVNFVVVPGVYMIPSDMSLRIGHISEYNNNLLVAPETAITGSIVAHILISDDAPALPSRPPHERLFAEKHEVSKRVLLISGVSLSLLAFYLFK